MCEYMEGQVGSFATEESFGRAMCVRYHPKTKPKLQAILKKKEVFKKRIEERILKTSGRMGRRPGSGVKGLYDPRASRG